MKRKWKDSATSRSLKPKATGEEEASASESSVEEEEDKGHTLTPG